MEEWNLISGAVANRRQIQIEDCLFESLQHTPYAAIRVADLCRQVGISRKAFYNYYHDKDDCLCSYIRRVIRESMIYTATTVSDFSSAEESATVLLGYWQAHRDFWDMVVRDGLIHFVGREYIHCIQNEDPAMMDLLNTANIPSDEDILGGFVGVQLTMILQWHARDFQPGVEEMAKKLVRMTYEPILRRQGE